MEAYETEEQQVAALKAWWKNNGTSVMVGIGVGIVIILGWDYWQNYQKNRAGLVSDLYAQALKAANGDQNDSALKQIEQIQTQYDDTDYAILAELLAARLEVEKNDLSGARRTLEKISSSSNKELANIAKIRLVRLMMLNKEFEQALKLINGIDPSQAGGFSAQYDELTCDLYVALDRPDQARTAYQNAQR